MIPKIKMLIVDVDGTLTDGGVYVDEDGKETKKFNAKAVMGRGLSCGDEGSRHLQCAMTLNSPPNSHLMAC